MFAENIKVALLGAGYIAKWHADALRRQSGVEITAICDLSEGTARSLADGYGVAGVETSLDDLLARDDVDCVHVLTPPQHHVNATRQIIESGRAAFVEKPFALSADECASLDELAKSKNVMLGVNHNFLMLPSFEKMKRDITSGIIGPIDTFEANWQFPLPPLRSGPFALWMLRQPDNILFEIGSHLFAFVADMFGELQDINVRLRNPITIPGGVTHYQTWQITGQAKGTAVTINLSLIEGHDNRSVRLRGLGGQSVYDFAQDTYRLERAGLQDIVIGPFAAQASIAGQALKVGLLNAGRQLKSLNGLSPYGLSITRAIESFYASLKQGKPVDTRLSADTACISTRLIERTLEQARPQFKALAQNSPEQQAKAALSNGKTVLVIGGTGFIGRALVTALADKGYAVRVFSRGSGGGLERVDGRVTVTTGDLKSDADLQLAMDGVDVVYHLAKATESTWAGYLENDVGVTSRIGLACIKANVARLVYTGTIDSYDASQPNRMITENTPFDHDLEQRNLYARSKAACEAELKAMERDQNLPLVIARPGIVIGKAGPLQHWGIAMWRGATACKLWGDGRNMMPFVLVDDVADGLVLAGEAEGAIGQSFNLIGDPMLSAGDYFKEIGIANNVTMRAKPTPLWTYFVIDVVKYWAKRLLAKRTGLTKPSYRDWKSRAQLSPFRNDFAKSTLGWVPETDRHRFIQRGIVEANLFGVRLFNSTDVE